jgi:hypothetical protein
LIPLTGFGGNWDTAGPGGPGTNIKVEYYGSWVTVGEIPRTYNGEFWGFVSDIPFTSIRLSCGSHPAGIAETYELDDMVMGIEWFYFGP